MPAPARTIIFFLLLNNFATSSNFCCELVAPSIWYEKMMGNDDNLNCAWIMTAIYVKEKEYTAAWYYVLDLRRRLPNAK